MSRPSVVVFSQPYVLHHLRYCRNYRYYLKQLLYLSSPCRRDLPNKFRRSRNALESGIIRALRS
uniref:Uncharacterized protein n=1 Tax=Utricularia reniformis TaxID=192314 RepID=A0A1Y0B0F1_9LAMI|nr:hypothetical protein AEK19_MT0633 [Utricularia reniformis]ART30887.1 hypothetical protein AEK19_MT0633 [Utricularia reniformis]